MIIGVVSWHGGIGIRHEQLVEATDIKSNGFVGDRLLHFFKANGDDVDVFPGECSELFALYFGSNGIGDTGGHFTDLVEIFKRIVMGR